MLWSNQYDVATFDVCNAQTHVHVHAWSLLCTTLLNSFIGAYDGVSTMFIECDVV